MTQDTGDRTLDDRTLGNLEGRVEELSTLVHQLHADMTAGFQQVNGRVDQLHADTTAGFQQVNGRVDQVNGRVDRLSGRLDRLILATWTVGGGMAAALVGVMVTLIVRGV